jgi:hypothetical protein
MPQRHPSLRPSRSVVVVLSAWSLLVLASAPAGANPVNGYTQNWTGTSLANWGGGAEYDNPGTGGVGGAGDGYLHVATSATGPLGTVSFDAPYIGNWTTAGITLIRLSLNDVNAPQALDLHFSIGNTGNFWQYNVGFSPSSGLWTQYTVDLTSPSWSRILGSGTFAQALTNVDRIHLRHDHAPFVLSPDLILGDFGLDRLILINPATPSRASTWGRIKQLYR